MSDERKRCCGCIAIPIVYVLVGIFTFAYIAGDPEDWALGEGNYKHEDVNRWPAAIFGGMLWPVVGVGNLSMKLMHTLRVASKPKQLVCHFADGYQVPMEEDGVCRERALPPQSGGMICSSNGNCRIGPAVGRPTP